MAGPAVGRLRTGRPGEIKAQATLVEALPGAAADAGSIPAASIGARKSDDFRASGGLREPGVSRSRACRERRRAVTSADSERSDESARDAWRLANGLRGQPSGVQGPTSFGSQDLAHPAVHDLELRIRSARCRVETCERMPTSTRRTLRALRRGPATRRSEEAAGQQRRSALRRVRADGARGLPVSPPGSAGGRGRGAGDVPERASQPARRDAAPRSRRVACDDRAERVPARAADGSPGAARRGHGRQRARPGGHRRRAMPICPMSSSAIAELPARQREALVLREFCGLSYEQVAAAMSVSGSAVDSLLSRARRRLVEQLGDIPRRRAARSSCRRLSGRSWPA